MYDLVWSKPLRTLAPEIGVSDTAIRKSCKKSGIPLPGIGYWNKKQAGKKVIQTALTSRFPGALDEIYFGENRYWHSRSEDLLNQELPSPPEFNEDIESLSERVVKMVYKVSCPSTINRVHPLIKKLLDQDDERREKYGNSPYLWEKPRFDTPIDKRRLRILNAIFLSMQAIRCKPSMTTSKYSDDNRDASIIVGDQSISFTLKEVESRQKNKKQTKEQLTLTINSRYSEVKRSWIDNDERKIEKILSEIVVELIMTGEIHYREHVLHQYNWKVERKAELEEEERQRVLKEEQLARELKEKRESKRIENLLAQAKALQDANTIRSFVDSILADANKIEANLTDIEKWAEWALKQADRIDPIKNSEHFLQTNIKR